MARSAAYKIIQDDILEHKRGCLVAKPGETVTRGFEIEIL